MRVRKERGEEQGKQGILRAQEEYGRELSEGDEASAVGVGHEGCLCYYASDDGGDVACD